MDEIFTTSYIRIGGDPTKYEHKTLLDCLRQHAKTKPDEDAVVFALTEGNRQRVTWLDLYTKSMTVANSFLQLGLQKKEIVAVNLQNCPEWLFATIGAMMAGAIPAAIVFTYTDGSDIIALMTRLQKCSFLIMDPGFDNMNWNIIRKLLDRCESDGTVESQKMPYLRFLLGHAFSDEIYSSDVKRFGDLLQYEHTEIQLPDIMANDTLSLFQTSGSTGIPKLVNFRHDMVMKVIGAKLVQSYDPKYILFNDRAFSWSGGYPYSLITGQKRVTTSGYCKQPENRMSFIIEVIKSERCSVVYTLPPLLHELIKRQDDFPSDWPVEEIVVSGQLLIRYLAACIPKACQRLICDYGGTELSWVSQGLVTDPEKFTGYCCGKPLEIPDMEIKIVDEGERIVPVNTRGEIYVRSSHIFTNYFNDPDRTKSVFTDDKWYKTDDIGRITENGELFVEGRKSNMIISGGINVAPEILEHAMKSFPGIETVIIVPVPDKKYHQLLCACVIKKEGSNVNEEDVRKYFGDFHADKPGLFTVLPQFYIFLEKFPETSSGKVNRKELESIAVERFKTACT